jgi:hypothetical protein
MMSIGITAYFHGDNTQTLGHIPSNSNFWRIAAYTDVSDRAYQTLVLKKMPGDINITKSHGNNDIFFVGFFY